MRSTCIVDGLLDVYGNLGKNHTINMLMIIVKNGRHCAFEGLSRMPKSTEKGKLIHMRLLVCFADDLSVTRFVRCVVFAGREVSRARTKQI